MKISLVGLDEGGGRLAGTDRFLPAEERVDRVMRAKVCCHS